MKRLFKISLGSSSKSISSPIGEEFIKDNNGQKLDLRKEAHIQTAENFEKGNFATHNRDVNYQERYDKWQDKFYY